MNPFSRIEEKREPRVRRVGVTAALCLISSLLHLGEPARVAAGTPFIRGDANSDHIVSLSDGYYIINFLYFGGSPFECPESGDANNNNSIDPADSMYLFEFLVQGGPTPCAPYPTPGEDEDESAEKATSVERARFLPHRVDDCDGDHHHGDGICVFIAPEGTNQLPAGTGSGGYESECPCRFAEDQSRCPAGRIYDASANGCPLE